MLRVWSVHPPEQSHMEDAISIMILLPQSAQPDYVSDITSSQGV
jgi:hypothetical protein